MPFPALSGAVARTARFVGSSASSTATDGELLGSFVRTRGEAAFADLVRRLGPMILAVCRRVSGDSHLAEDAFQATFVVLARRAADIRPAEAVRAWLYGVAVRTAREARAVSARRLAREVPVSTVPDRAGRPAHEPDADALAILDEEVAALPDHLRVAVVSCEIDCVARRDAAKRLGIPEGTLSSRLAKARKLLAARLRKRGISLPIAGLGMLAHATVPSRLAAQTSMLASTAAPLSPAVAALSNGVFRTMFFQKLTIGTVCGLAITFACLAARFPVPSATAQDPPKPPVRLVLQATSNDKQKPPTGKPAGPGAIIIGRDKGAYWVVAPDGTKRPEVEVPANTNPSGGARLSPDGKRVAYILNTETAPRPVPREVDEIKPWPFKVIVRTLDKPDGAKEWELPANHLSLNWTADGKKLIASKIINPRWTEFECVLLDPDTGKTETLEIPTNARVMDCGNDGKTFVVQSYDAKTKKCQLGIAKLGDKDVTVLCDLRDRANRPTEARLSPNGKTILFVDADPERKDAHKWGCSQRIYTIELATRKREPLSDFPDNARAWGIAWSPDGKKLAYTWVALDDDLLKKDRWGPEEVQKETEGFLIVADADGKNAQTVATDKGRFAMSPVFNLIDWR